MFTQVERASEASKESDTAVRAKCANLATSEHVKGYGNLEKKNQQIGNLCPSFVHDLSRQFVHGNASHYKLFYAHINKVLIAIFKPICTELTP